MPRVKNATDPYLKFQKSYLIFIVLLKKQNVNKSVKTTACLGKSGVLLLASKVTAFYQFCTTLVRRIAKLFLGYVK